jgi:adenine-specific DNA-methyltransferase
MSQTTRQQKSLFPEITSKFPSTRYQGSKSKLSQWIWEQICDFDFCTCLDSFGGTGAIAYRLKQAGKRVTYNDLLRFNYSFGLALIENAQTVLNAEETYWILSRHREIKYPTFVQDNFEDVYFTKEENIWIDQTITNIKQLSDPIKFALAFFALCQACIIKRPYNLFHRKNLYIRFAEVQRSFGNKATWDKPFEEWFRNFVEEANAAVFDNGTKNRALNFDAFDVPGDYDLVYIDTPYISRRGISVDYLWFYHFLEGLTLYDDWRNLIDHRSKHRRMKPKHSVWTDKSQIRSAFDRLFRKHAESILVVSYRSDGIPSETELVSLMKRYKRNVRVEHFGQYKYVLSTNSESKELMIIGS